MPDTMTESPPPASIQHTLSTAELFAGFERDGFYIPDHPLIPAGLYRAMAVGDCLCPVLAAGDTLHIERGAMPQHGDIVMFEWLKEVQDSWSKDSRRADWISKHGNTDFSRGMKLFWRWPQGVPAQFQDDYLIANDGMRKLGDNKILGVLRAVERNGVRLTGDLVRRPISLASIDPNAATQIAINNNNGAGSGFTGITGLSSLGIVASLPGPTVDCTLIVTATIQARQTAGTLGDVKLLLRYTDDSGATITSSAQEIKIVSASFQTYAMQWQFAHSHLNASVVGQASIWSDSGSTSDSYDWQLATLQMEHVIR
jgi:hypothetical protein